VDWVVVDWNGDNMRLDDDWVWDLDWNVNWEWNLNFLHDWDFDFLVDWIFFNMMMMDSVHVVWNGNLDVLAAKNKRRKLS
jgi:hypothetical protein